MSDTPRRSSGFEMMRGGLVASVCLVIALSGRAGGAAWEWPTAEPASQGMDAKRLDEAWDVLKQRQTTALLVIRHDRIVFERYAGDGARHRPHYTASMAKALVGGMSLILAMQDGKIRTDDPASRFVPAWGDDDKHRGIQIRHLATHTSGIEDAEADNLAHDKLAGWKGGFWKRLPPPDDPFTLSRDKAPVLDPPGTRERYSNPGMAMLAYCLTAAYKGSPDENLRALLKRRVMDPIGAAANEWSVGYGQTTQVDGLPLVASWGGGAYSPDATARVGRLLLHDGTWDGRDLVDKRAIATALKHSGLPGHSGLGWWVNRKEDGSKLWNSAPEDAFWGSGAGQQILFVAPSLDLIVVRNGQQMDAALGHAEGLERYVVAPIVRAVASERKPPVPPSPVFRGIEWEPKETIVRKARGSDVWPLTWGDDDALYAAYGDGRGFEPFVPDKLSLGFAKVLGGPDSFEGINIRSSTGERKGDGAAGEKASGLLMIDDVLWMLVRNAGNARLAWSRDHAKSWTWADWTFTESFGCPTFVNFGPNYAGARDDYVYIVSPDGPSAYRGADRMVMARVPKSRMADRAAYEFFMRTNADGAPVWTREIGARGAVFTHPGGFGRSSMTYHAGLKRYLWCQTLPGDARFSGGFGVYDAPEPWGPWTTVDFHERWDVGPGETCSFPTKWMSADGRRLFLVFSGDDAFSVRGARLLTGD